MKLPQFTRESYPLFVLGWVVLLVFWSARDYLQAGAPFGDDHSAHYALCVYLSRLFTEGISDFYWGQSNMGLPLFISYQPLPSMLTAGVMTALPFLSSLGIFKTVIVLIWSTMPIAWYLGGRWLGMRKFSALLLGLMTLTMRSEWHVGFTITSSAYEGLFTQSWGQWMFPLALGAFYRCVWKSNLHWSMASILAALTVMSHLFTGLLLALACACLLLARPRQIPERFGKAVGIAAGAFALTAFWLIPLLMNRQYLGGLPWMNETYDGWSLLQTLQAFGSGQLLDAHRLPWMTGIALLSFIAAIPRLRTSFLVRGIFLFGCISFCLMGGREVWGSLYPALPMHTHINPFRYVSALQMVGAVSVAHMCGYLWEKVHIKSAQKSAIVVVIVGVWSVFQLQFMDKILKTEPWENAPIHRVAGELSAEPEHRFLVDGKFGTGSHFHRDLLPLLAGRPQLQSFALGYHGTFSTYYARYMAPDLDSLRLFNVNTIVSRKKSDIPEAFEFYRKIGPYTLYRVPDSENWGVFDLVWPGPEVSGALREMRPVLRELSPQLFSRREVAVLKSLPGESVNVREKAPAAQPPSGTLGNAVVGPNLYETQVSADPNSWLMLKVNFFPFWEAYIDGNPAEVHHVGPNFMAVELPGGKHHVRFQYKNPPAQKWGAVLSFCLIFVLVSRRVVSALF